MLVFLTLSGEFSMATRRKSTGTSAKVDDLLGPQGQGFFAKTLAFYVQEIHRQATFAEMAIFELDRAAAIRNGDEVYRWAYSFCAHSAQVSHLLWPGAEKVRKQVDGKEEVEFQEYVHGHFLRTLLGVHDENPLADYTSTDDNPLKDKQLRNSFAHADRRFLKMFNSFEKGNWEGKRLEGSKEDLVSPSNKWLDFDFSHLVCYDRKNMIFQFIKRSYDIKRLRVAVRTIKIDSENVLRYRTLEDAEKKIFERLLKK